MCFEINKVAMIVGLVDSDDEYYDDYKYDCRNDNDNDHDEKVCKDVEGSATEIMEEVQRNVRESRLSTIMISK